jgi:hypothetical protein
VLTGGMLGLGGPVPLGGADPVPDGMLGAHTVAGFGDGVAGSVDGVAGSVDGVAGSVDGVAGSVDGVAGSVVEGIVATVGAGLASGRGRPCSGADISVTPGAGGEGNG